MAIIVRKPRCKDVDSLYALIRAGVEQGVLLPRSRVKLFTVLRDFFVLEDEENGAIAGCCSLSIMWEDLAEVRSLYVGDAYRRQGLGQRLVRACIDEAAELGLEKVFCLTYQTEFFATMGFTELPKESLPQKIWTDCVHCPKFPNCDEVAMIRSA